MSNKGLFIVLIIMLCHYSFGEKPDLRSPDFMDKRAILDRIKKHRESKYDGRSHDHTLDKVRAHEEHRMNKMKEILETRRTHLQEHAEGTRVLTDEEHAKYTRQVNNFQRKLDERSVMSDHDYENMLRQMASNMRHTDRFHRDL